jgi:hypothetical protein
VPAGTNLYIAVVQDRENRREPMSKILFQRTDWGSGPEPRVEMTVGPFARTTLVLSSAWGRAHYQGERKNAGIRVTIDDGEEAVASDSFEGESSNLTFTAAVATHRVLPPGQQVRIVAICQMLGKLAGQGVGPQDPFKLRVVCLDVD